MEVKNLNLINICGCTKPMVIIIIYDYQPTRFSSSPKDFLGDYSGYLQIDGYTGYNNVENAKKIYCLAYIRRKYYDIVSNLDKAAIKKSRAIIEFNYC
ncbi:IS66 family transposase [Intestinibacter bartlettii]|uniref:IS66 family transposase n=1 Tax=Intestinibacter bartlettii TaxID=261299 RepID=UPI002E9C6509|nr:transposase [Intestinibacter bartlettii]